MTGVGMTFLRGLIGQSGCLCILWPLSRDRHGYGQCYFNGKLFRAHRIVCELTHGEAPTSKHHAAHICGNRWCVNPNHIEWKTGSENQYDRRKHGTHGGGLGRGIRKLTDKQAKAIITARGKIAQSKLAKKYNVCEGTVRAIQSGRLYKSLWGG